MTICPGAHRSRYCDGRRHFPSPPPHTLLATGAASIPPNNIDRIEIACRAFAFDDSYAGSVRKVCENLDRGFSDGETGAHCRAIKRANRYVVISVRLSIFNRPSQVAKSSPTVRSCSRGRASFVRSAGLFFIPAAYSSSSESFSATRKTSFLR